jgi:hypothetical protein
MEKVTLKKEEQDIRDLIDEIFESSKENSSDD